jgi:hypothetical protein
LPSVCGSLIDDVAAVMAIGCSRGKYFQAFSRGPGRGRPGIKARPPTLSS